MDQMIYCHRPSPAAGASGRIGVRRATWVFISLALLGAAGVSPAVARAASAAASGEKIRIRVGFLAPEMSTIVQAAKEGFRKVEEKSQGRIDFVFYAGGVLGDEPAMVRKVRIGQLEAVAISGALANVVPESSILSLPFLFRTLEEVDYIREWAVDRLAAGFDRQGLVFLLWFDMGGFVQLFSNEPVRSMKDLTRRKLFIWRGVPIMEEFIAKLPSKAIPIEATDMLSAMQTGMVDSLFSNPLVIVVFQLQKYVRYMTRLDIAHVPVALLIKKETWASIPPDLQGLVRGVAKEYAVRMSQRARMDDETALKGLVRAGVSVLAVSPEELEEFRSWGRGTWQEQADKLYPRAFLDALLKELESFRARKAAEDATR